MSFNNTAEQLTAVLSPSSPRQSLVYYVEILCYLAYLSSSLYSYHHWLITLPDSESLILFYSPLLNAETQAHDCNSVLIGPGKEDGT